MPHALKPLIGAALLAAAPAAAASPEAELAAALEGHVAAGAPVDCVDLRQVRSTRIIQGTAIVYDTGRTLYVNRPRGGAESLSDWDMMVTRTPTGRLCSVDVVELRDRASPHMMSGLVFLGEFVPYRRAD